MNTPAPITTLTKDLAIVVRLPIEVAGQRMTAVNDIAVLTAVEENRSRLNFTRNNYVTWADNELLLNNEAQFVIHVEGDEVPLPYDFVTTADGRYLVVDFEGNEVANAISEDMAQRIAIALLK